MNHKNIKNRTKEILSVIQALLVALNADDMVLAEDPDVYARRHLLQQLQEDITMIQMKVAPALSYSEFGLQMEHATLIKMGMQRIGFNIRQLSLQLDECLEYCRLIEVEIELFKTDFAIWVSSFNPYNYEDDGWSLYQHTQR